MKEKRETATEIDRQRQRQRYRHRHRETDKQTHTHTHTHTHRERQTQRDRDRQEPESKTYEETKRVNACVVRGRIRQMQRSKGEVQTGYKTRHMQRKRNYFPKLCLMLYLIAYMM